jgi:hypothetical protein
MNCKNKVIPKRHSILELQSSIDDKDIIFLFERYDQLLRRHSWTLNGFDYDLYSECKITFLKCLKKFSFDEKSFQELYDSFVASRTAV